MKIPRVVGCAAASATLLLLAGPALAEAHGNALGRALTALALYGLGYLTAIVTLIVLAVRRRKRLFLRVLAIFLAVILVYPLLDSSLMLYQKARVAAAEITHPAPDLSKKKILFISFDDRCYGNVCEALVELQAGEPLWVLPLDKASLLDFSQPIDFASIPLAKWMPETADTSITLMDAVDGAERPVFDYVVFSRWNYYQSRASGVIDVLPQKPKGTFLGDYLSVSDLAAPIENNQLDLASVKPDLLLFYNARKARRVPLFLENTIYGSEHGMAWRESRADWYCGSGQGLTDAQYRCRQALR